MNKVENDLEKSKSIREKQSKDFTKQVEQLKVEHRKEVSYQFLYYSNFEV